MQTGCTACLSSLGNSLGKNGGANAHFARIVSREPNERLEKHTDTERFITMGCCWSREEDRFGERSALLAKNHRYA
jgi:hypothetical protein